MYDCNLQRVTTQCMKPNQVTLFLEPIDVAKWRLFQQYYEPFSVIIDSGVFSIKNGSACLRFDANGILQKIERDDILYSRVHK